MQTNIIQHFGDLLPTQPSLWPSEKGPRPSPARAALEGRQGMISAGRGGGGRLAGAGGQGDTPEALGVKAPRPGNGVRGVLPAQGGSGGPEGGRGQAATNPPGASDSGTCPICRKTCAVVGSTGLLHAHGPRGQQCPGSRKPRAPGSRPHSSGSSFSAQPGAGSQSQRPTSPPNSLDESSADLFSSFQASPVSAAAPPAHVPIGHPSIDVPILKRIPKGARPEASRVLLGLLRDIERDSEDSASWTRLFDFAPTCLRQPGHGGKSRNLTTSIKKQIQAFQSGTG